jgi:fibro-slime domain-containing protein
MQDRRSSLSAIVACLPLLAACGSGSSGGSFSSGHDSGAQSPGGGYDGGGSFITGTGEAGSDDSDGGLLPTSIVATIHDFRFYDAGDPTTNPDFENPPTSGGSWDDRGLVATQLGTDGTPTYAGDPTNGTLTTHGNGQPNGAATNFAAWYHDTAGTNIAVQWPVPLVTQSDGSVEYDSAIQGMPYGTTPDGVIAGNGFFPVDDGTPYATAFGNQGWPNNYSFTCEIHTVFVYKGGEYFNFRGDDDVFVFINEQLVIDLGGVHGPETAQVEIDSLGLTLGKQYPLDFFSAERHVTGSNILFQTTLALSAPPPK